MLASIPFLADQPKLCNILPHVSKKNCVQDFARIEILRKVQNALKLALNQRF